VVIGGIKDMGALTLFRQVGTKSSQNKKSKHLKLGATIGVRVVAERSTSVVVC